MLVNSIHSINHASIHHVDIKEKERVNEKSQTFYTPSIKIKLSAFKMDFIGAYPNFISLICILQKPKQFIHMTMKNKLK